MAIINIKVGSMTTFDTEVTQVGDDLYRLEEEACLFLGAETDEDAELYPRYGDVIQARILDTTTIQYEGIHSRAPLNHFVFAISETFAKSEVLEGFLKTLVHRGGIWGIHIGGLLMISIPIESSFKAYDEFWKLQT